MWFYFALLTALFSALIVIINKHLLKESGALFIFWTTSLIATPIVFLFSLKEGFSSLNIYFLIGIIGSDLTFTFSKVYSLKAIRMDNLSNIFPLSSFGAIFTLLVAFLPPLSERPSLISIIGVIIIILGSYLLNVEKAREGILRPFELILKNKAALFMMAAVMVGSLTSVFDKLAINNSFPKNATFALLIENLFLILIFFPLVYFKDKNFHKKIKINFKFLIPLGVLNAIATLFAMNAIGSGDVGVVNAIFRTQLLLVLLFSFIFFKDKPSKEIILGSIVMIIGVLLIKFSSGV